MTSIPIKPTRPVILCILDGWGSRDDAVDNAIILGNTPNFDKMTEICPVAYLDTSGLAVGLPEGQMGNSEVGHTNLGAGRIVIQDLPLIDAAIKDGSFSEIAGLKSTIASLKSTGGTCHLMGLMSTGGVHSHQDHMLALTRVLSKAGIPVAIHAFLD
ncbi:2,3-bisphosphoglycerate-independent phosphoglycerate mutase, partial [hydrothermal vent metagenome]